ncbi:hypothetical protein DY000_02058807 [Brassica cretica]|uniref:Uncharacterized protein n=1 Tax=Brassica cretica TaxID=69181 RepID=A0ABQ7APZ7_BRACR|nr:hypothetical protein DY000_02058807 [Brassica cretica]
MEEMRARDIHTLQLAEKVEALALLSDYETQQKLDTVEKMVFHIGLYASEFQINYFPLNQLLYASVLCYRTGVDQHGALVQPSLVVVYFGGPKSRATHWKQTVMYLEDRLTICEALQGFKNSTLQSVEVPSKRSRTSNLQL